MLFVAEYFLANLKLFVAEFDHLQLDESFDSNILSDFREGEQFFEISFFLGEFVLDQILVDLRWTRSFGVFHLKKFFFSRIAIFIDELS